MEYQDINRRSRRTFLFGGFMAAVGRATTYAQQQVPIPETLTQWLGAPAGMRNRALRRCLDRIQRMEPSIHAWVQVSPQRNTGRGRLSGIPYGVKDIVETRGLATEYGIRAIPTLLIFKDGQVADQIVGLRSKRDFKNKLDRVAS